jgi:hypothetical protein
MAPQYLVIGKNDAGESAPFALLTRAVFESYEAARRYADQPFRAHRKPEVVECPLPIKSSIREPRVPNLGDLSANADNQPNP